MRYRTLGRTGVTVSELCLGAMMYGAMGNRDHDDCVRQIHHAIDAGINFIDTADVYSRGESEEIVGAAIRGRRDDLVIATKFFSPMDETINHRGGSRRWIVREVEDSLRRLGIDHIDLYQCHRFPEMMDLEETISALTDLRRTGKIRYFGSSAFPADRIVEGQWIAERTGLARFRSEQASYSMLTREIEKLVIPACQRYGIGVIVYSPLAGGWLSGRYRSADDFTADSRIVRLAARWGGFDPHAELNRRRLDAAQRLQAVADEAGLPLPRLALAWTLEHPGITSAIIGPRTFEQLDSLLGAEEIRLTTDVLDAIDEIVPPGSKVSPLDPSSDPASLAAANRRRPR
ncbi:MAG TPA: aldo/keto reductase [Acidimicrobiales bacterium]|jgi:aryl-alcohol dehydrogenase-like predicted oxidoreductase|nr:aldo/keto reductase [Acidimicrobiales bacterium]